MVVAAAPTEAKSTIRRLTVFKTGTHTASNGSTRSYTQSDLDQIAGNYNPEVHEAPLIIGHAYGTSPAYGWVKSLHSSPGYLEAEVDFHPEALEFCKAGLYKKWSIGIYTPNSPSNPYQGELSLRELSLLGASPPAIKGLPPVEFAEEPGVLHFEESLDYTMGDRLVANIFQRFRDYLIDKEGLETANSILPGDLVQMVYECANSPDPNNQMLLATNERIAYLSDRLSDLEAKTSSPYIDSTYKEAESGGINTAGVPPADPRLFKTAGSRNSLNYAATKMFGQSKKKKTCTKGTPCGVGCINGKKTCRKGTSPDQKKQIQELKQTIKAKGKAESKTSDSKETTSFDKPAQVPSSLAQMKDYVQSWQKERGFETDDPGMIMHDMNHGLTYLALDMTPEQLQKRFSAPDRKFDGTPDLSEEMVVQLAEYSFLPKVTKDYAIERVLSGVVRGATSNNLLGQLPQNEVNWAQDESARRKDLSDMYDLLQKAPPEVKQLLKKNNFNRLYERNNYYPDEIEYMPTDDDNKPKKFDPFNEDHKYRRAR